MKKLLSIFILALLVNLTTAQIYKTVNVITAGTLTTLLTNQEKSSITNLTVTGNIDARDVKCIAYEFSYLTTLDISNTTIQAYSGTDGPFYLMDIIYPANEFPELSFFVKYIKRPNIKSLLLPVTLTSIGGSSIQYTGISSILIPNKVISIKKTAFQYCANLKTVISLNTTPPTLEDASVFQGSPISTIYVPVGCVPAYRNKAGWSTFTNILEYILTVSTKAVSTITLSTAVLNGNIDMITETSISAHGFCWNTTGSPTITDNTVDNGTKLTAGAFNNTISNLSPNTKYYVKTYATDGIRTVYGSEVSFTTASMPDVASEISGAQTVHQGQNSVTYTVPAINNATSYVWTLPTGASGISTTNSITVNYAKTAISGNITVKGRNVWGDGATTSLAVSVLPLIVNCADSLSLNANIVYPVKISFELLGYEPSNIGMAVYAEDSTTMICSFNKNIPSTTDTTLYLGAGKYYLAWLSGGANLKSPTLSGENASANFGGWTGMTQYLALPFKVIAKKIICEGQLLLNATTVYNGSGNLKYKWIPSTGLNNDSIARPTATVSSNINYTVIVTTPYGCSATSNINVTVASLTANAGTDKTVICGNTTQLNVTTNYTGTGNLKFKWTPSMGLDNDTIKSPKATIANNINYTVTATTPSGCTATDSIKLTVTPIKANAGADKTVICGGTIQLNNVTTDYTGNGKLRYKWTPATGLNNDTIANPTATVFANTTYTVAVSTPIGCTATDDIVVSIIPMTKPEIGIVGVSNTNKNRVVWNKPTSTGIASYCIYKETTVSDVFEKVGSVSYDSLSVFVDNQSAPDVKSNKYKLSILDRNGLESPQSSAHKTMHLSINKGQNNAWNLIWEPYEGFPVYTYNIYRGTSPNNLNFLDATSGSSTQYSDLTALPGDVYYQLEVITSNLIAPTKVPASLQKSKDSENSIESSLLSYSSSRSNIASNYVSGTNELAGKNNLIKIYPNPVKDELKIDFEGGSTFEIINLMGQVIYSGDLNKNTLVQTSSFSSGVYLIRIRSGNFFEYTKMVKE